MTDATPDVSPVTIILGEGIARIVLEQGDDKALAHWLLNLPSDQANALKARLKGQGIDAWDREASQR